VRVNLIKSVLPRAQGFRFIILQCVPSACISPGEIAGGPEQKVPYLAFKVDSRGALQEALVVCLLH
jgi:hypothetical protein